jgi:hypothetical protein
MRMDVSSIQTPLRIRGATESCEDSPLSIQHSQSTGGGQEPRRRDAEREGSHSTLDDNPLSDVHGAVRLMRWVAWTRRRRALVGRSHDGWKGMFYLVVTRLLICDRELLHRD